MNQPPDAKYVDRSLVSFQPSLPEVACTQRSIRSSQMNPCRARANVRAARLSRKAKRSKAGRAEQHNSRNARRWPKRSSSKGGPRQCDPGEGRSRSDLHAEEG